MTSPTTQREADDFEPVWNEDFPMGSCPSCGFPEKKHGCTCPPLAAPEAPAYRALQVLANPYNEKDHGPAWQVAAHAWDMAIISAMRIVGASTGAAPEAPSIARDWLEDAAHENGNYMCKCSTCGNTFIGHKRRVTCKACAHPAATDQPSAGQVGTLPCPFCGSEKLDVAIGMTEKPSDYIMCNDKTGCGAMISREDTRDGNLIAAWNRRASLTPTAPQAASQQAGENFRNARTTVTPGFIIRDFDPPAGLVTTAASLDDVAPAAPQAATTAIPPAIGKNDAYPFGIPPAAAAPHPITDAELRDPEYMRSYIEECSATLGEVLAENKRLREALARAPLPGVVNQEGGANA